MARTAHQANYLNELHRQAEDLDRSLVALITEATEALERLRSPRKGRPQGGGVGLLHTNATKVEKAGGAVDALINLGPAFDVSDDDFITALSDRGFSVYFGEEN
jgi:hypothetical protein